MREFSVSIPEAASASGPRIENLTVARDVRGNHQGDSSAGVGATSVSSAQIERTCVELTLWPGESRCWRPRDQSPIALLLSRAAQDHLVTGQLQSEALSDLVDRQFKLFVFERDGLSGPFVEEVVVVVIGACDLEPGRSVRALEPVD